MGLSADMDVEFYYLPYLLLKVGLDTWIGETKDKLKITFIIETYKKAITLLTKKSQSDGLIKIF